MAQAARSTACKFAAVLLYMYVQCTAAQQSVAVRNGFELHSVLASGSITQIYVAENVSTSSSRRSAAHTERLQQLQGPFNKYLAWFTHQIADTC
jgi:hypothetical protein